MFNSIKKYYNEGRYNDDQVKIFVKVGWITEAQYKEITGKNYVAQQ